MDAGTVSKESPILAPHIDTAGLKKFAQEARLRLRDEIATRLEQVLRTDSVELRERESSIKQLKQELISTSKEALIDRVAYTWFNRFCALRFMDVNRYTSTGSVSPVEGFTQPELLAEAKQGHIDESLEKFIDKQRVFDLLGGRITSRDPQQEAYSLLLVAICNYYNAIMPFLFEKIADYTELLMPDDLLSESSILAAVRETLTANTCKDVEIIGWLYQFYISEKKDEVFEDLKKNKKIAPENIPAATQLFTPQWIVRYLVENSLGRLWMLNRPDSRLIDRMEFYIKPEQVITDFSRVNKPEELKICDPACGSGHMLVYAFDLLYAIYEEEGYDITEIPRLILEKNLYGIEIDERAGELSAFALVMKAREKYRRFFNTPTQPNICVLENIKFEEAELSPYLDAVGHNLFTENLQQTLHQFRESNNFGSLIRPAAMDIATVLGLLESKNFSENIFLYKTHQRVLQVLRYADFLSPKYHVVIANPPYMGGKGMNGQLKEFAEKNYPGSKSDTFGMFIERAYDLVGPGTGLIGMIVMESWMFQTAYEKFRDRLLSSKTILSLLHMPYEGKGPTSMGIAFGTTAVVLQNSKLQDCVAVFDLLRYLDLDQRGCPLLIPLGKQADRRYLTPIDNLLSIPGKPIAYWISGSVRSLFSDLPCLSEKAHACSGIQTGDNERFLRLWHEVSLSRIGFGYQSVEKAAASGLKWFPHKKGGDFRRWYGNNEYLIDWSNDGSEIKKNPSARPQNISYMFREGVTWSHTSSGTFSARYSEPGFTFNVEGPTIFSDHPNTSLGFLCSAVALALMKVMSSTLHFLVGSVSALPFRFPEPDERLLIETNVQEAIKLSKEDWNSFETSWDFTRHPLMNLLNWQTMEQSYNHWEQNCNNNLVAMKRIEENNNKFFIRAFGLQDEISSEVQDKYITLQEPNQTETAKQFLSFAVGCMFGRYSLDKPGLILANQGATKDDYLRHIPEPMFPPDDDNVIPILDGEWFTDDISDRFRKFLRVTFGDKHYNGNLEFLERALGKDIRKYFLKDFYQDHVKRYKKRPIYWLFSSSKGSFNALVYMHRYRPDTVSIVLNDYLREFRTKLNARKTHLEQLAISTSSNQSEKTKALKEIENLKTVLDEIDDYERDVLYPLASKRIELNLDDGVKINYTKFGVALKPIAGLEAKEE